MNIFHFQRFLTSAFIAGALTLCVSADEERSRAPGQSAAPNAKAPADVKLDLNTAELAQLEAVPVIGLDLARAIVAARPFATIDELDRVKGISAERLEQIRAVVMVGTIPHIPAKLGEPTVDTGRTQNGATTSNKVDLNTADVKTLEAIPSIGAETARAIVAARPFGSVDELSRVKGISTERLEQIRAHVTATPPRQPKPKLPAP